MARCLKFFAQKSWVRLYWPGYWRMPIHGRYPTTAERGDSCLLRFRPGPVRPSLDNLMSLASAELAILTPGLVRTPDRHSAAISSTPDLKPSTNSSFPVAGLQECATTPSWEEGRLRTYRSVRDRSNPVSGCNVRSHIYHFHAYGVPKTWNFI